MHLFYTTVYPSLGGLGQNVDDKDNEVFWRIVPL